MCSFADVEFSGSCAETTTPFLLKLNSVCFVVLFEKIDTLFTPAIKTLTSTSAFVLLFSGITLLKSGKDSFNILVDILNLPCCVESVFSSTLIFIFSVVFMFVFIILKNLYGIVRDVFIFVSSFWIYFTSLCPSVATDFKIF